MSVETKGFNLFSPVKSLHEWRRKLAAHRAELAAQKAEKQAKVVTLAENIVRTALKQPGVLTAEQPNGINMDLLITHITPNMTTLGDVEATVNVYEGVSTEVDAILADTNRLAQLAVQA